MKKLQKNLILANLVCMATLTIGQAHADTAIKQKGFNNKSKPGLSVQQNKAKAKQVKQVTPANASSTAAKAPKNLNQNVMKAAGVKTKRPAVAAQTPFRKKMDTHSDKRSGFGIDADIRTDRRHPSLPSNLELQLGGRYHEQLKHLGATMPPTARCIPTLPPCEPPEDNERPSTGRHPGNDNSDSDSGGDDNENRDYPNNNDNDSGDHEGSSGSESDSDSDEESDDESDRINNLLDVLNHH